MVLQLLSVQADGIEKHFGITVCLHQSRACRSSQSVFCLISWMLYHTVCLLDLGRLESLANCKQAWFSSLWEGRFSLIWGPLESLFSTSVLLYRKSHSHPEAYSKVQLVLSWSVTCLLCSFLAVDQHHPDRGGSLLPQHGREDH
jgi:hypothetical protein